MKEKIFNIVPDATIEEKGGILFVTVPQVSFHDLALRLRKDTDFQFDFLVCMTGMDWGETLGVIYHLRSTVFRQSVSTR